MSNLEHGALLRSRFLFEILICVAIFAALNALGADSPIDGTQPLQPNYDETWRQLPPGVPRIVDTNGNVVYVNHRFTLAAYRKEALKLVTAEANRVAKELALPEELPITESSLVEYHISPFGFAYAFGMIGNVTTKHYIYGVAAGDKFNNCTIANYDKACIALTDCPTLPIADLDTNLAFQLATQWLRAVHVDVAWLNRDCAVKIGVNDFWNGLPTGVPFTKTRFVPIYDISWLSPRNQSGHYGDVVFVEMYSPAKELLQLSIGDPRYILRAPLIFTNLASLFPGVATVRTNYPVKPIIIAQPYWK